jgi:hypothetical protein
VACPTPDVWIAWLAGPEAPRGDLQLAHLEACPSCRGEVAALVKAEAPGEALPAGVRAQVLRRLEAARKVSRPRAGLWIPALAAALLLAAGIGVWRLLQVAQAPVAPTLPPSPQVAVREPAPLPAAGGAWQAQGEVQATLGRAVAATLAPGSLLRWLPEPGLVLALESGRLRLESPGESLTLAVGDLRVALAEGEIEAGLDAVSAPHAGLLLGSAWAGDEGIPYVRVLRGAVRVQVGERGPAQELQAGREARPDGAGGLSVLAAPAGGPSGWKTLGETSRTLKDGSLRFDLTPAGDYRFEVLLRKRRATAECALGFVAAGVAYEIPLGSALGSGEGWTRLSVAVSGGWCRVTAGSRSVVSCALAQLPMKAYPSAGPGLRAWGGDLELRDARWREGAAR